MLQLTANKGTHPGRKRRNNEDFVAAFEPVDAAELKASGCLYVLADGVGGAAFGERASQYAAERVLHDYYERQDMEPAERLRRAIAVANADIFSRAKEGFRPVRMATTIVCAVIRGRRLLLANVGDSRAYLIRNGEATQLTRDHNIVGELVAQGEMTEAEAMASKAKNRLTRSVGGEAEVHVQLYDEIPMQPRDRILLCSDGLTRYATREQVAELASRGSPQEVVKRCIAFANARGGADNVSAIMVEAGEPSADKTASGGERPRPKSPDRKWLEEMPTDPGGIADSGGRRIRRRIKLGYLASAVVLGIVIGLLVGVWLIGRPRSTVSGMGVTSAAIVATSTPVRLDSTTTIGHAVGGTRP